MSKPANNSKTVLSGKWKATTYLKMDTCATRHLRRFVKNRGVKCFDDTRLEKKIIAALREGHEVRLFGGSVRLFHCVDKDYRQMFVAAATLADSRLRNSVSDIEFELTRKGKSVQADEVQELERCASQRFDERKHVTPDLVVTCPNCGTEFRVGKSLA